MTAPFAQQLTRARFYINGESTLPHDGLRLFTVELCTADGHEYERVWARDEAGALMFVRPFKGGKLAEIVRPRMPMEQCK